MSVWDRLRRDAGFTLTELLVVIGLLGFVVGGAYSLFHLARVGTDESNEQAWSSREIGQPLENMERMFTQQAPPLVSSGTYSCEIKTDQDRDNHYEFHRFEATADGRLIETVYEQVDNPNPRVATWSEYNANVDSATPLFTYYDIEGTDITAMSAVHVQQYAASVKVEIVTDHDGTVYGDTRRIFFRNR